MLKKQLKPGEQRELWRKDNDYVYLHQVHGIDNIGICCDGRVIEMEPRTWHQLMTWQNEYFDRQCELFGAFGSQERRRRTIMTEEADNVDR